MSTRRAKLKAETVGGAQKIAATSSTTNASRGARTSLPSRLKTHRQEKADVVVANAAATEEGLLMEVEEAQEQQLEQEQEEEEEEDDEEVCYFVDQKGNYYFQAGANAEPVLAALGSGTETFPANDSSSMKIEQDGVSYVLIMEDGENKSAIVADVDDGQAAVAEEEIYEFDDPDYVVDEPSTSTKRPSRLKKASASEATVHMCNYCNYNTKKMFLLSRHLKTHSEDRPHKCSVCERGFKTMASLQNHVNTHTGTKPHRCKICESCFTTSGELVRHMRYKHTHERPHKCTECDYSSVELSKLKRHIRTHTGEKPFQCPHCTYASPDKFKLTRHLRIHTGEKPYSCDICFARFTQSNSLKAHKLIHQVGDKPVYQCELCPTTCGRKTDLRIHVQKLHTAEKPITCKRCDSTFEDRYSYKMHVKTHEGERCFKCEFCPYASISARHLESHLLLHTDQKPFKCNDCSQCFRQKQLLKRHINYYHNPDYVAPTPKTKTHVCPNCPRHFRHRGNLIRHMALHDPDSQLHEEQAALREGRQKKVQITLEEGGDNCGPETIGSGDVVTVQDDDGQYVVLEVIQLQDQDAPSSGSNNNQPVARRRGARTAEEAGADKPVKAASSTSTKAASAGSVSSQRTRAGAKSAKSATTMQVKVKAERDSAYQDTNSLDAESDFQGINEEETEEEAEQQEIVIEQGDDSSANEFILSTEDLEDTHMLISTLEDAKRERYDLSNINISQSEIEKNMSNCFGFSDDEDEEMDQKGSITLLH